MLTDGIPKIVLDVFRATLSPPAVTANQRKYLQVDGGNGSETEEEGRGRRHTFGSPSSSSADLLVGHHAVGLQGGGMPAEQSRPRPIVLAEDSPIDVVEAVTRDQAVPAGRTGKTLQVVNVALRPHHHLAGWYRLSTRTAGAAVSKQPYVVVLAEDHASFAVAGAAVLAQLRVAARALEAARVPVALHGEEQEAVGDPTSAPGARPGRRASAAAHHRHGWHLHPAVHHSNLGVVKETKHLGVFTVNSRWNAPKSAGGGGGAGETFQP